MSRFQRKPLPESRNPRASAFGALDFAVDDAGSWWFYEINPNGQWFWIERQTGLPISAALAKLLEGRPCTA